MMFWPEHWARTLEKQAARLARRPAQQHWRPASSAAVEQDVLLGFYAVRTLLRLGKLSAALSAQPVPAWQCPATGAPGPFDGDMDRFFHLVRVRPTTVELAALCDIMMNAVMFTPVFGGSSGLHMFCVAASPAAQGVPDCMWQLDLHTVIDLFERVVVDIRAP